LTMTTPDRTITLDIARRTMRTRAFFTIVTKPFLSSISKLLLRNN
jgi:hypothetical protein